MHVNMYVYESNVSEIGVYQSKRDGGAKGFKIPCELEVLLEGREALWWPMENSVPILPASWGASL